MGRSPQNEDVQKHLDTDLLWAEIYTTDSDKPRTVRLKRRRVPKGKKLE